MDNAAAIFAALIGLGVVVFLIAAFWKIFEKAGQEGWKCLIPIYSNWVMTVEIADLHWGWFVGTLIPYVNFIAIIWVFVTMAKKFGKGWGFALGMVFLAPIFIPILGFGGATYEGSQMEPAM